MTAQFSLARSFDAHRAAVPASTVSAAPMPATACTEQEQAAIAAWVRAADQKYPAACEPFIISQHEDADESKFWRSFCAVPQCYMYLVPFLDRPTCGVAEAETTHAMVRDMLAMCEDFAQKNKMPWANPLGADVGSVEKPNVAVPKRQLKGPRRDLTTEVSSSNSSSSVRSTRCWPMLAVVASIIVAQVGNAL